MDEYISRKAAFEILQSRLDSISQMSYLNMNWHELDIMRSAIENAIDDIGEVPAADVQLVRFGKWVNDRICSECGFDIIYSFGISGTDFCPCCGARMIKGGDIE